MKSLKVIDKMCGCGKSHYILNKMMEWSKAKEYDQFVYISPLLSEVGGEEDAEGEHKEGRVQRECKGMSFRYPIVKGVGGKGDHIRELLLKGNNISATHNLFLGLEDADIQLFKERRNVLVIDEAVSAFQEFGKVSRQGVAMLISNGNLLVDEDNIVKWNHTKFPVDVDAELSEFGGKDFEYKELIRLCNRGHVHLVQGTVVIWEFPKSVLESFDEVIVLTYLFKGSFMSFWCELNNIKVEYLDVVLYKTDQEVKDFVKEFVTVADAPPLKILDRYTYSYTWWYKCKSKTIFDNINKALASYIKNYLKGYTYEDFLFTYPKFLCEPSKIKGKGFTKADWLAVQTRATNDYAHKRVIFYLYNRYPNSTLLNFCKGKGGSINEDYYAVSEIIQYLWRGCSRKGEPMVVVIASKRMRKLFNDWLYNKGSFGDE